jgi:D-sedoheptulose 7-phosphate isomerase
MKYFEAYFRNATETMSRTATLIPEIETVANKILAVLNNGGVVYLCGNGGSASDAQHIAAELIGRFKHNRRALASICLNTDTSALTAIANDFGYQEVFARQLEGLGKPGDIILAITTSGKSKNIIQVLKTAKNIGLTSVLLTGGDGGEAVTFADISIIVPSNDTCHIQESHIAIGQAICGYVENNFL